LNGPFYDFQYSWNQKLQGIEKQLEKPLAGLLTAIEKVLDQLRQAQTPQYQV
jgi:hypothetical protein